MWSEIRSDAAALIERWQAARQVGEDIPSYAAMVLGNLGRHADDAILITTRAGRPQDILWAGTRFMAWLRRDGVTPEAGRLAVAELTEDVQEPMREVVARALALRGPARSRCDRVFDGIVTTTEFLGLPLAHAGDDPLVLLGLAGAPARYDLVKAMFGATDQGMLALSTLRTSDGEVTDFKIVAANEGAARLLGCAMSGLQWQRLSAVAPGFVEAQALGRLLGVIAAEGRDVFELSVPTADGRDLYLKIEAGCIGDLLALTFVDVGDLKVREASARLLFENNPLPMWLVDQGSLAFVAVNDAALVHYGHDRDTFLRMTLANLEVDSPQGAVGVFGPAAPRVHRRADGSRIEVNLFERVLDFHGRSAVLTAIIDVTEQRRAEARIAHMAHHDALTGLPNRVLFRARLGEAIARLRETGRGAALLCLDLDHFKSVNDTLGHSAGDDLLRHVSARLLGCVAGRDGVGGDVVARMGGDEFAILLTGDPEPEPIRRLSERIVEALGQAFTLAGQQVRVGTSIGIAVLPRDGTDPDHLLRNADLALYRAKAAGRDTHCWFETAMEAGIQTRQALERDLRAALAAGDLEVHYQPVQAAESGRLTGFEALLRWHHPQRGFVAPAEFLPLAEETGLIGPVGAWVLRQACTEAAAWPAGIRVAVTLSPVQFRDGGLAATVGEVLAATGLAPGRLELEIPASVLPAGSEATLATLHRLRALGTRIALDDFGTGCSSLGDLRTFPVDRIKIAPSFVSEMGTHPPSAAIVRAIIGLGTSLGIAVTAEGIETRTQAARLCAAGCGEVQGLLYGQPMRAAQARQRILGVDPDSLRRLSA